MGTNKRTAVKVNKNKYFQAGTVGLGFYKLSITLLDSYFVKVNPRAKPFFHPGTHLDSFIVKMYLRAKPLLSHKEACVYSEETFCLLKTHAQFKLGLNYRNLSIVSTLAPF